MPTYQTTPQFEHGKADAIGILLVNLGTPDAPTAAAVRRFLKPFLWDRRVVEYPRVLWWLILNLVILRIRPARSAAAYKKIWGDDGSPLMVHSQAIASALRERLTHGRENRCLIELAMSYSDPSIDAAIDKLLAAGARRILTLPMYPQYSGTTTASVIDAVAAKFAKLRWIPEARFVNDYHAAPGYIDALANCVRENWDANGRSEKLLMSFHGVPQKTLLQGDPYHCQCHATARLLASALDLNDDDWMLTFQSRVGREQWLTPYTDQTLQELGAQGTNSIDVICPGFSVDCLETLEEIAMQNAELFSASGGGTLHYIESLNARDDHITFLADLVRQHTMGWVGQNDTSDRTAARDRAIAMGAER